MSGWRSLASLGGVLLAAGCGEPRVIGLSCPPEGCALQGGAPYKTCVTHELSTADAPVLPNGRSDRCQLFTLDELTSLQDDPRSFLSVAIVEGAPARDDLDLRMAESVPGWPDGIVRDCARLLAEPIAWVPLATTVGVGMDMDPRDRGVTDLEAAPILASRTHRLLLIDSFTNMSSQPVEPRVKITLKCATRRTPSVSEPFELANRAPVPSRLQAGGRLSMPMSCTFQHPTVVQRLYRRTRLTTSAITTSFVVRALKADPDAGPQPLWASDYDWTHELESPTDFFPGEGMAWDCTVFNSAVTDFTDGAALADACSLFGLFRVGEGNRAPSPEACVPR
jgi:hypothetical protein